MIERYSLPEMAAIWSEERKLAVWQEIETLVVEAWAEMGVAPAAAAVAARGAPPVDAAEWRAREETTNHDVAAFVDVLGATVGEGGEWVHHGLTSSDVVDTAQAVLMKESVDLLIGRIAELFFAVKQLALQERDTVVVGRTHGIWAEPTTFGLKLATWAFELSRDHERLRRARSVVAVGKLSGAVGTYAHVPPSVEAFVCERLGLTPEPAATQVTQRDRHAELLTSVAITGASLERFATEIRHLQRSEVAEVFEPFGKGQKGSSAMPHKRNPIGSENVSGLARLLRGYAAASLENIALWHERDISHSSVERVAIPDALLLLDFGLARMTRIVSGLEIDRARMQQNVESTRGLIFSQALLLALVEAGMGRDDAYRVVQRNARDAWESGRHLRDIILADPDVILDKDAVEECFDPARFLRNGHVVFDRLEQCELG